MAKISTIEYSFYIYLFLGIVIIVSIIYIFVKINSLNSKIDTTNNNIAITNNNVDMMNNDLKNVLQKLTGPTGQMLTGLFYAGADVDSDLNPSDLVKFIGIGKSGFTEQHWNLPPGTVGYCNVLTMIPNVSAYISQILISTVYGIRDPGSEKLYIRYSKGIVKDVTATPPIKNEWTNWIPL